MLYSTVWLRLKIKSFIVEVPNSLVNRVIGYPTMKYLLVVQDKK